MRSLRPSSVRWPRASAFVRALIDNTVANAITKLPSLSLTTIADNKTQDLYRAIRSHLPSLIPGLLPDDLSTMSLGLSHSLSRHKLKFSPDKIDTMVVQAIALLDDLDKELNTCAMRVKEWYGWHFPELGKILNDNLAYARVILAMGMRTNASNADLAEVLPEEIEASVKAAAEVSMGTEITAEDLENIQALAEQVVEFTDYRQQLSGYLSARMAAIAPNLTALVGDLVGARLIAHAGSLMNLAKSPASTIQILGAEKALFRALKTKHDTPKYGLIYHASLIGQATGKNKGKIARVLAAKTAIGLRVDALADWEEDASEELKGSLGTESRLKIERRLAGLEGKPLRSKGVHIAPNGVSTQPKKWEIKEARKYNPDADGLAGNENAAAEPAKIKGSNKIEVVEDIPSKVTSTPMDEHEDSGAEDEDESMEDADDAQAKAQTTKVIRTKKAQAATAESDGEEDDEEEMEDKTSTSAHPTSGHSNGLPSNGVEPSDENADANAVSPSSTDSPDSPTQPEPTKIDKKARKRERHEQHDMEKQEHNEKLARRLARREKKQKKETQGTSKEDLDHNQLERLAALAGLSVTRYKRKQARGEIEFKADGTPVSISKKDIKKARKAAKKEAKAALADPASEKKKRKRETDEGETGETERKKKKRDKESKKKRMISEGEG